ncbi:MAG: hypothetical protein DSM106950_03660 [Stigonema ocellatum SAG 48.90 = DSM 106950]|nr:hypothetical protein [Stigonema ocellatum SAG 48.90 = DSM 106950]
MNIENLENELISFELSDEDLKAIKGGAAANETISSSVKISFPIRIVAYRYPWYIIIKAPPIEPLA